MGKVIKGEPKREAKGETAVRGGVLSAEVYDARQAAQALLEQAQREREAVLAEAREQGRQEGLAQVAEQLVRARQQAAALLQAHEQDAVALALRIAARVLGRDVARAPELLVDLCATALEQLRGERAVVLRVHPDTAAVLRERRPELHARLARGLEVTLKEDASVQPVGCVLQTEFGTLDAQLDTQLQMLERVLLPGGGR